MESQKWMVSNTVAVLADHDAAEEEMAKQEKEVFVVT